MNKAICCFGRFNPPTRAHEFLFDEMAKRGGDMYVWASHSAGDPRNPLPWDRKLYYMMQMFSRYSKAFQTDDITSPYGMLHHLVYTKHYKMIDVVCGSDRMKNYLDLALAVGGASIAVVTIGNRDPDDDDHELSGISASKMRAAVKSNDWKSYERMLPTGASNQNALDMWHELSEALK